ncbi:MAG: response regulator transcription factor [Edaphocola sp.]
MAIKILLYDDNELIRKTIPLLLNAEEMQVVATQKNPKSVIGDIEKFSPDIILMDIDMPGMNGVEAVQKIRSADENLPVVMLTVFEDNAHIFDAICAGASGYILKKNVSEEIENAIKMALKGEAPMTGSVAKKVLQMLPRANNSEQKTHNLSARENDILQLLVKGFSYKMIASELYISIDTVRFHIKKIYEKLQVHSATEAVSKALKNRWT